MNKDNQIRHSIFTKSSTNGFLITQWSVECSFGSLKMSDTSVIRFSIPPRGGGTLQSSVRGGSVPRSNP